MAGATLTTIDKILKDFYLPALQDQFNKSKVLLYKIKRGPKYAVSGKQVVIPLVTQRHFGHGPRAEDTDLPTAGNVGYDRSTLTVKNLYGRLRITGPAIEAAKNDRGAFVRSLDAEIRGTEEGFGRMVNRMLNNEGSGLLAICGATTASTTINVKHTRYCEVGQVVDILTIASGSAIATARTITAVDAANNTITISGSAISTTDKADGVYLTGARNQDMMGILGIVNDRNPANVLDTAAGTGVPVLQGLDVSTATFWKSTRLHNSGTLRPLSIDLLQDLLTNIDLASGQADGIDMLFSRHGQWNKYGLLLIPDRRYGGSQMELDGGFKYLTFDGIPWYFDRDCWPNRVFALNTSDLVIYEMAPIRWADREGHVIKPVANRDAWEAWLYWYAELGVGRRFVHGVLEDLDE